MKSYTEVPQMETIMSPLGNSQGFHKHFNLSLQHYALETCSKNGSEHFKNSEFNSLHGTVVKYPHIPVSISLCSQGANEFFIINNTQSLCPEDMFFFLT